MITQFLSGNFYNQSLRFYEILPVFVVFFNISPTNAQIKPKNTQ